MQKICALWLKHCGRAIPAKDTFMFHHVDGETGKSIISCHSFDSNIFKLIGETASSIKRAKEQHEVITNDKSPKKNNYFEKKEQEAKQYGISAIAYLSSSNTGLPERDAEYGTIIDKSSGNMGLADSIKYAITNAKRNVVYKVKDFLERHKEKNKDIEQTLSD